MLLSIAYALLYSWLKMRLREMTGRLKLSDDIVSQSIVTWHKRHRKLSTEACTRHLVHPIGELASFAWSKVELTGHQTSLKAMLVS